MPSGHAILSRGNSSATRPSRDYFLYDLDSAKLEGFRLAGDIYQPIRPDGQGRLRSDVLGLDLGLWQGTVDRETATWARLFTSDGGLVLTRAEAAEAEVARLQALLLERNGAR